MIPLVDLKRQYLEIKEEVDKAALQVLKNGNFILGKEVGVFEKEFAKFCKVRYCVGVACGWDALLLSLKALGIKKGDEVIVPANTFIATVFPIIEVGAKPVLVDIDKDTYQIDPNLINNAITKKTRAILPVHLYGIPAEMNEIKKIAKENKLFLVEDAAQAHGSVYRAKPCGSFGDIAAFSFYPGKNLGAGGDGGAVVTNKRKLAETIRIMRDVGQDRKYFHPLFGYNSRLDTIQAAMLTVKLKRLNSWNKRRRILAKFYDRFLSDLPLNLPPRPNKVFKNNYHLYVVRTSKRDGLIKFLKKNGVICGIHYPLPIHLQKSLKNLGYIRGDFPITERYAKEILSLPLFPQLTKKEVIKISKLIHKFFRE